MNNKNIILLGIISLLLSCEISDRLDEKIIGKWKMEKVYEYNKDVTEKHNPNKNRWIKFNKDSTFTSDGDPFGKNTGRWNADNKKSVLYIYSNVEDDNSEWKVIFKGDSTIWTGIGHPRKENTRLVHTKMKD